MKKEINQYKPAKSGGEDQFVEFYRAFFWEWVKEALNRLPNVENPFTRLSMHVLVNYVLFIRLNSSSKFFFILFNKY